jgi:peptidyl-prolyl cis-trans isomerase D
MLSTIREKAQGWIAWVIVVLISIPFALWGINEYFSAQEKIVVAEVNGDELLAQDYQEALTVQRANLRQQFGRQINSDLLDSKAFKLRILNNMITQRLLAADLREQNYRIGDEQLAEYIRTNTAFQVDGEFSPQLYEQAVRRNNMTTTGFESQMRLGNIVDQVMAGFQRSAIISPAEIDYLIRLEQERRDFAFLQLDADDMPAASDISDDQVAAMYDANKQQYQTEESTRVEYIVLSLDDLARQITPDEDALRAEYEEQKYRYVQPERRSAQHILLSLPADADEQEVERVRELASDLAGQARQGADFAELAKQYSSDTISAERGGDLGFFERGVMDSAFEEVAFSMQAGEVSDPVRSKFGFHVIKLSAIEAEHGKPFAEVRDQISTLYAQREAEARFGQMAEELKNLVYEQPTTLAPAADAIGLQIQQSDWFSRSGGEGMAANRAFVDAAFTEDVQQEGLNSEVVEVDDNTLVAMRLLEHRAASQRPLAEVADDIRQQLALEARMQATESLAKEMVGQLRSGTQSLEQLAEARGLSVETHNDIGRSLRDSDLPEKLLDAVFRMPAEAPANSRSAGWLKLDGKNYAVFVLRGVTKGDPAQAPAGLGDQMRQILEQRKGSGLYADYERGLRSHAEIVIYEDRL